MKFGVYVPAQIGWGGQFDPEVDRSLLVPLVVDGVAFPNGVHKLVEPLFRELLRRILPLIPGGLQSPGCWGYNAASKSSGGGRSFHTYGLAIDVNAPSNPMNGRRADNEFRIPDEVGAIANELGFEWGGNWSSPIDWMHFDYHGSPAEAAEAVRHLNEGTLPNSLFKEDDDMTPEQDSLLREANANAYEARRLAGDAKAQTDPTRLNAAVSYVLTLLGVPQGVAELLGRPAAGAVADSKAVAAEFAALVGDDLAQDVIDALAARLAGKAA